MTTVARYFGFTADTTPGGTNFDGLSAGVVPAPTTFWPVTTFNVDKGEETIDREDEIVPVRGARPSKTFKQAPTVTIGGKLYTGLAKKLAYLAQGQSDARTGTAPAASLHVLDPLGLNAGDLPAIHIHLYRDGLYERIAGCTLSNLKITIPNDAEATWEATFQGLYRFPDDSAFPTITSFDDVDDDWVYVSRDSKVFLDGSLTPVPKIRGYELEIDNALRAPDHDWSTCVESIVDDSVEYRLWWPARRRLSAARKVTGRIMLQEVSVEDSRAHDLRKAKKLEVFSEGPTLTGVSPAARESQRYTHYLTQYTSGSAPAATRDGDLQMDFDFQSFISAADSNRDLRMEFVDATYSAITAG